MKNSFELDDTGSMHISGSFHWTVVSRDRRYESSTACLVKLLQGLLKVEAAIRTMS